MLANRGRDTRPELAVRRLLHAAGARYRVDFAPLGGTRRADIVFTKSRLAVFIDGCFWHCCPDHRTAPARNRDYWGPKLQRNVERDQEVTEAFKASGWRVLRFWEHEDPQVVAAKILDSLRCG